MYPQEVVGVVLEWNENAGIIEKIFSRLCCGVVDWESFFTVLFRSIRRQLATR